MHIFVARFLNMWVWMTNPHTHPHSDPYAQESSNKDMDPIEFAEFHLGISFLAFSIICGRRPERYIENVRFFAHFLKVLLDSLHEKRGSMVNSS